MHDRDGADKPGGVGTGRKGDVEGKLNNTGSLAFLLYGHL